MPEESVTPLMVSREQLIYVSGVSGNIIIIKRNSGVVRGQRPLLEVSLEPRY